MVKKGRKSKRKDRGSTDDETTVSKRPNMAASDFECEQLGELQDDHSTLSDIHDILKNLQKSIRSISNEVAELKLSFKNQETELRNAKDALKAALVSNNQLRTELQETKKRVKEQEEDIKELYDSIDTLEQYSRKNSIEIVGIPENVCENEEAVLKIAAALNVQVKAEDIDICHRVKRKKSSPIIARFISHKVKRALYKNRVQLKNVKMSQLFPSASAAARVASDRIFINENLTVNRRKLVKLANDKKADGLVLGVWTVDGKVFVKTSPEGRPIRIYEEADLDNL